MGNVVNFQLPVVDLQLEANHIRYEVFLSQAEFLNGFLFLFILNRMVTKHL